jgi:hypothetical protein
MEMVTIAKVEEIERIILKHVLMIYV